MPRWLKIILKILLGILLLIVIFCLGAAYYINTHKKELMGKITARLNEDLTGKVTVEDISPEFIRGFPAISVSLKNVLLRDSLYETHHHDLVKADYVYVAVDAFSLLHDPIIRTIEISNGAIHIYTDSAGYCNANILKKKDSTSKRKKKPELDHVYMRSVLFTFEHAAKAKLFQLDIHNLDTKVNYTPTGWSADADLAALVKSFAFNTAKGSYLKNKELLLDVGVDYDEDKRTLSIPQQTIKIDRDAFMIGGQFDFAQTPGAFKLEISSDGILFKNAAALLSPNISSKLTAIDLKRPVNVAATINGRMKFRDTPLVHVTMHVRNDVLTTPSGQIKNISFDGSFQNRYNPKLSYRDDNSLISMSNIQGSWENIPFTADSVQVYNLVKPVVKGRFRAHFPLERLNPVIGSNTFTIKQGTADMDVSYRGGLLATDTSTSSVHGRVQITDAAITYLPRNMKFTNTNARVSFNGADIFIEDAKVQCGTTVLNMNGSMRNFMSLYYTSPDKLLLDWNISSHRIDLREFLSFLTVRQAAAASTPRPEGGDKTAANISKQLDNVLAASSVHMKLKVDKLLHRSFVADNIDADIMMEQASIALRKVEVDNAGGHLSLTGDIAQSGHINDFRVNADIINVRIPEFFKSFDNFGQDAITDKNMMGRMYARVDVTGSIRDTGAIIPNSFNGKVDFEVRDGALINFGPFLKVSKFIFRKRDLGNVRFGKLKNTLEIKGDKIYMEPMMIESSAINLKVGGVYSLTTGTDIDIDIPLRNPKDDELIIDDSLKEERNMKGIVIHLNAVDGDDGNVKIKLRLGKKKTREQENTIDEGEQQGDPPKKKKLTRRLLDKLKKK